MSSVLRVLIVDNSQEAAERILQELSRGGFDPAGRRVAAGDEMSAALAEDGTWDLILCKNNLPGFDAAFALSLARQANPDILFVIICAPPDEKQAIALMRAGANDYLVENNLARLPAVVERELREAENRRARRQADRAASQLVDIVRFSDDAIVSKTLDGIITSWNPAAEQLYGWTSAEALGRHISIIVPSYHNEELERTLERLRRGERTEPFQTVRLAKDGTHIDVEMHVSPLRDRLGRPVGGSVIFRDIRARIQAERERQRLVRDLGIRVKELEALHRTANILQDESAAISTVFEKAAAILPTAWQHTEVTAAQITWGENQASTPDFRQTPWRQAARFVADGLPGTIEVVYLEKRPPASEGPFLAEERSLLNSLAEMLRIYLERRRAFHNITARREAEAALLLRDRAIRTLPQGIVITDPRQTDNPIIYASSGVDRLTGYTQEEILGKNCRFLQGKETDPDAVDTLRKAIHESRACVVELLNYRKDGSSFWNQLAVSPVKDEQDQLTHFIGVQTDVTERRLLEDQYRQSQKMEAIGQLAGGVAHDFNNFLTIISGYADLLLQTLPRDDPNREFVQEIHRAGERSASLTRQLLALSRRQVVAPKWLNLNTVIGEAEKMLQRMIGKGITLTSHLEPTVGMVKADPGQLDQVLLNLAVNARDAMPDGGRLTIETSEITLNEDYAKQNAVGRAGVFVVLTFTDTGCGMPEEVKSRIFEPFYTTKEAGKGTGLGLAVVHGIVKQAGGHVEVYSEPGRGASFKVYLPRVDQPARPEKPSSGLRSALARRGTETLLLVEAEEAIRVLSRRVLSGLGYQLLEAVDGAEALQIAGRHRGLIDLLVSNIVVSEIGGPQLAEELQKSHPEMKVLYLSGATDDAIIRHGILEGNGYFLQKPFSPAALVLKVREILDARNSMVDTPIESASERLLHNR